MLFKKLKTIREDTESLVQKKHSSHETGPLDLADIFGTRL
jgi:hypothetical protein